MKNFKIVTLLCMVSIIGCKKQEEKKITDSPITENVQVEEPVLNKTYAEISIKEGGKWVDRKYEGGNFKNVESLKVPQNHTDHSYFIRYEGPGWESNKVGYRLYLDWRNAIDIFGKTTDSMILSKVGLDGFDSYHEKSDWGMDILKAGKSLGIGSVGRLYDGKVLHFNEVDSTSANIENTPEKSSVIINYNGWKTGDKKINLKSILSIKPDKRYTKYSLQASDSISGICTGIVKFEGIELIKKESENKNWGYLATYGQQTLVPDNLGMAIFYNLQTVDSIVDSEFDHLIVFKSTKEQISYYFLGAWEQEKDGIKTKEAFFNYLDEKLKELNDNNKL